MSHSRYIGPELPPNFNVSSPNNNDNCISDSPKNIHDDSDDDKKVMGPVLPSNLDAQTSQHQSDNDDNDDDDFGPALPPGFELPSNNNEQIEDSNEDEDDDIIGPVPDGQEDKNHQYDASKRKFKKEKEISKREKWMLEPPKALAKTLQLQTKSVTKFSQKSSKKDTTLTKEQKLEQELIVEKEGKMREFLDKYEKSNKRDISLLDQHRKDLNKNKKLKSEKTQRKEFDRDTDLNVPKMDNKMKNSFIKEASSTFTNRFSGGKFEKFL